MHYTCVLSCVSFVPANLVTELHDCGNGCIEGLPTTVIITDLGNGFVSFPAQCFLGFIERRCLQRVG